MHFDLSSSDGDPGLVQDLPGDADLRGDGRASQEHQENYPRLGPPQAHGTLLFYAEKFDIPARANPMPLSFFTFPTACIVLGRTPLVRSGPPGSALRSKHQQRRATEEAGQGA